MNISKWKIEYDIVLEKYIKIKLLNCEFRITLKSQVGQATYRKKYFASKRKRRERDSLRANEQYNVWPVILQKSPIWYLIFETLPRWLRLCWNEKRKMWFPFSSIFHSITFASDSYFLFIDSVDFAHGQWAMSLPLAHFIFGGDEKFSKNFEC